MWYSVDWNRLVLLLLPTFLRKPKTVAFLQALVAPISQLHYQWTLLRFDHYYKLYHNGQVCKLRKLLNDELDPALRRIYITDGNSFPRKYIYTRAENKPVFIGTMFIYQNDEYTNTGADFTVFVPAEIVNTKIHELRALIEFYKLASKRYKIQAI
ncbi:hypothetical protein [Flavobacterium sp.]|jgi:hypothetical protein|uniref:hypothetical protein n=1 Tax=Flavobacterium sp. TaxID=239 RepID=UPI0037BE3109